MRQSPGARRTTRSGANGPPKRWRHAPTGRSPRTSSTPGQPCASGRTAPPISPGFPWTPTRERPPDLPPIATPPPRMLSARPACRIRGGAGPMEEYDVLVVGGGFYGCLIACHLRRRYPRVLLVEKQADLLERASYVNQARVHQGY